MPESTTSERIDGFLDASISEMVRLLDTLIACQTDSQTQSNTNFLAEARQCQAALYGEMTAIGLDAEVVDFGEYPAVIGHFRGAGDGRSVALNGHFDVVPAGARENWQSDPWSLTEVAGSLYGRGVVDMKAGIVAQLFALRSLAECGVVLMGDVWAHYVSDEEIVGESTRNILASRPRVDGVIDSEPTGLAIMPVEGGLVHLRVEVQGVESHAGNRYTVHYPGTEPRGVNAIEKAIKLVGALQALERDWAKKRQHPLLPAGFNTIAPGLIFGGPGGGTAGRLNIISNAGTTPNYASVEFNIWFLPSESFEDVKSEIEEYLSHVCATDPWLKTHPPTFTWKLNGIYYPPCSTSLDDPIVSGLVQAGQSAGLLSPVQGFGAASELAWYAEAGIAGSLFGPGAVEQAHSPNECLERDQLVSATKVLARTLISFCGSTTVSV